MLPRDAASTRGDPRGRRAGRRRRAGALAALLALSEMPVGRRRRARRSPRRCASPRTPSDRWIPDAATAAAARHDAGFLGGGPRRRARGAGEQPRGTRARPSRTSCPTARSRTPSGDDARRLDSCNNWQGAAEAARRRGRRASRQALRPDHRRRDGDGADSSVSIVVKVSRRPNYRLSGRIRTRDLHKGTGHGRAAQRPRAAGARARHDQRRHRHHATGRRVQTSFNSGERQELTINCLLGGWGRSTGTAWFDDVRLEPVGDGAGRAGDDGPRRHDALRPGARRPTRSSRRSSALNGRRRGDRDRPCSTACSRAGRADAAAAGRRQGRRGAARRCRRRCRRTTAPASPRSPSGSAAASCSPSETGGRAQGAARVARRRRRRDAAARSTRPGGCWRWRTRGQRRRDPEARHARSPRPRWRRA